MAKEGKYRAEEKRLTPLEFKYLDPYNQLKRLEILNSQKTDISNLQFANLVEQLGSQGYDKWVNLVQRHSDYTFDDTFDDTFDAYVNDQLEYYIQDELIEGDF